MVKKIAMVLFILLAVMAAGVFWTVVLVAQELPPGQQRQNQQAPCDALCIQQQRVAQIQREAEAARLKQQLDWQEAIQRGDCVPVKPKPCGWLCRQIRKQQQDMNAKLCTDTNGKICETPDVTGAAASTREVGACPPNYEPAKGRAVPPAPVVPIPNVTPAINRQKGGNS